MSKTFTLLSDLPSIKIDRCAQILPNRMQCYRTGVWLVQDSGSNSGGTSKSEPQTQDKTSKQKQTTSYIGAAASKSTEGKEPPAGKSTEGGGSQDQPPTNPPADKTGSPTSPAPASSGGVEPYQLCIAHKIIAERAQEQASKSGGNADEIQAKILGDEENWKLNHLPISPDDLRSLWERDKELKKEEEHDTKQQPAGTSA